MAHIIIGTAGHIDHGKSALVKKLTGTDPDRLAEEQQRGMTIDIGFAFLNKDIAFIDVPGHERFIKNMVAGVSTVDMALLVVAADDGVMPQTREHLDILNLLQLKKGIIAITKSDLVEKDWLMLVQEEIKSLTAGTFLKDAPIICVSSHTGDGIDSLKQTILETTKTLSPRPDRGVFWMPVDRSFTIKGFGTVVTGSVLSGRAQTNDLLELLPGKKSVRVRGLQSHGNNVETISIGDRAAINIANIEKEAVKRGDILATANYFQPTKLLDAKINILKSITKTVKNRARVRVHIGTREVLARIKCLEHEKIEPGASQFVQLLMEEAVIAMRRDPIVIRQYSPTTTIGGGIILDTQPKPHKRFQKSVMDALSRLEKSDPEEEITTIMLQNPDSALKAEEISKLSGHLLNDVQNILEKLTDNKTIIKAGPSKTPIYYHSVSYQQIKENIKNYIDDFHKKEPLKPGIAKAELKSQINKKLNTQIFEKIIQELLDEKILAENQQWIKGFSHKINLSDKDKKTCDFIETLLIKSEFSPPAENEISSQLLLSPTDVKKMLNVLQSMGKIKRLEGDIYFPEQTIQKAINILLEFAKGADEISVSDFRTLLSTSRKYALALLSYFDEKGITERVQDVRLINKNHEE